MGTRPKTVEQFQSHSFIRPQGTNDQLQQDVSSDDYPQVRLSQIGSAVLETVHLDHFVHYYRLRSTLPSVPLVLAPSR